MQLQKKRKKITKKVKYLSSILSPVSLGELIDKITILEIKQTTSLIGQTFYKTCPDDDTAYRTIRVASNFVTGNIQTYVANPFWGDPESNGLETLPPHIKVNSCNNVLPYTY